MKSKVLWGLAALLVIAGCGGNSGQGVQAERAGDSVVIAMDPGSEPEAGFDPAYGWGAGEHVHEPLIQSTLTVTTADLGIDFDLATALEVSDDGLVWTAEIRQDVRFTDGEPLTAGDVAFTYNTVKELSTVNDFTMLDAARAVGDFRVEFHLNRPYSIWPYTMAVVGILPEHAYGPDYGQAPIGSGRYLLRQWDKGQQVILEANPDYYGEAPRMKRVTIVFMGEDAAFAAVRGEQVDLSYTAAAYGSQEVAGYDLLSVATVDNRGINLPAIPFDGEKGNDFTSDALVRRAIHTGLDREQLIDHALEGYGSPAYSVCDKLPWFSEASVVDFDRAAALDLLEQAGWTLGEDGMRSREGVRASLNILYPAGDSLRQAMAAQVAEQLREMGVEATFEGVGWDTAYDRAQSEPLVWGWGAHTPMEFYNIYHTAEDGLAAYSPYVNEQADRYMDEALMSTDLEQSYALWQMAQWDGETGVAADLPWVWLANVDHLYWVKQGLQVAEQKLHPHGHGWSVVNNVDRWYWA